MGLTDIQQAVLMATAVFLAAFTPIIANTNTLDSRTIIVGALLAFSAALTAFMKEMAGGTAPKGP